jgi:hypothetical protein
MIPFVPTQEVADVVCSSRLVLAPALIVVAWGVREIAGPVLLVATLSPQAATTAAETRTSATRGTRTNTRLIFLRVMSYPRFFFWVHCRDATGERRLGRKIENII